MAQPSPEQMFEFYKARLTEVFTKRNPNGLKTIDSLLRQFPGKEHQVYCQICKISKVEPLPPATPADFIKISSQEQIVMREPGEVSKWLTGHGFDRYSKLQGFQTMAIEDFLAIKTTGRLIEIGVIPKHSEPLLTEIFKEGYKASQQLPEPEKPVPKADFEEGENCFTKMMLMNSKGGEKWLNAKVTHVNDDNTFDISVYNASNYGVPPDAVNVPRNMLKKSTEDVEIADPKRKNSKRPQFQQGDRVRVSGLRSHTSYNGLCGTVLLYVPTERRYQVRLDTNDVIAIKQRNVGAVKKGDEPPNHMPLTSGMKNLKKINNEHGDDAVLAALMLKLMRDNPGTDAGKLGEFAAGYLLSKKKHEKIQGLPSNIT